MMDFAYFRLPDGQAWMGEGPFSDAAEPPCGPAFYINDFTLSDPCPWKVPAVLKPLGADDEPLAGLQTPGITWTQPETEWFKMVFRRIRKDVLAERVRKMVPVLTERGILQGGDLPSLVNRVHAAPAGLWGYGRVRHDEGFLGSTPELLLQVEARRLQTMALAGTAKPDGADCFESDMKEIEEHEIVAGFLEDALSGLGTVHRSPRRVSDAAGLTHFCTNLSVELANEPDLNALVKLLHPTPAVGCLPRDEGSLQRLMGYRRQLKAPAFFGAPFGLKTDDVFHGVVAIRGLCWEGGQVLLPSGCGIVSGSAYDHEWRELRLKRENVIRLMGV